MHTPPTRSDTDSLTRNLKAVSMVRGGGLGKITGQDTARILGEQSIQRLIA